MQSNQDNSNNCGTRLEREMAYWDGVYDTHNGQFQNYSWMEYVEQATFNSQYFRGLLDPLRDRRILSIGGGVDRLGVDLAKQGHQVVCVDISPAASARTREQAQRAGVSDKLTAMSSSCEEMQFAPDSFDVVVCKRALHHMEIARVVPILHDVLVTDGVLIAEEPVCLHRLVRWVHERFPFYGDAPHTQDEKELTSYNLHVINNTFRSTRFIHFDLLARESVAYQLNKRRWSRLLYFLGKTDFYLANRLIPPLRQLCNYVIIYATK
jgi:SAM-dependent methyltransferase